MTANSRTLTTALAAMLVLGLVIPLALPALGATVEYRVNAGGLEIAGTPPWEEDSPGNPSQYNNVLESGQNNTFPTPHIVNPDSTVPLGTPAPMFRRFRFDPPGGTPDNLEWDFPVTNGAHEVRLYFAEIDKEAVGERIFDVYLEGDLVLDDLDIFAEVGHDVGTMRSFLIDVSDANVDIEFEHVVENPVINGIEILSSPDPAVLVAEPSAPILTTDVATSTATSVEVTNDGTVAVWIEGTTITGVNAAHFSDDFSDDRILLAPGESFGLNVIFDAPTVAGNSEADLTVLIEGSTDLVIPLSGEAIEVAQASNLTASTDTLAFNDVAVGGSESGEVTLTNSGEDEDIVITSLLIDGTTSSSFSVTDPSSPVTLAPGESVDVTVDFAPSVTGLASANLRIEHTGVNTPTTIALTGTGTATPAIAFTDISDSIFQTEIIWLASEGITRGCNPPENSQFCPTDHVTRGQMAAFLHRALSDVLIPGEIPKFVDDDTSVFEDDIEWLGATGVTRGCNPPANDRYCPNDFVTRGQMAAFLHRALDGMITPGDIPEFVDDNDSVFEDDIEWLGATGVTRGCNPPANDRFCPGDFVTREQMAAFLYRAFNR